MKTFKTYFSNPLHPLSIWLKISILALVSIAIEPQPTHPSWAVLMILIAAFILVPIGFVADVASIAEWRSIAKTPISDWRHDNALVWHLFSAISLAISFTIKQGFIAGLLALPYLLWCTAILLRGIKFQLNLPYLTQLAAWGFLTNAAVWLVFDRFNYQPLNFTAWIVLLTGAHFHYAGFALTLSLALLLNENPNNRLAGIASLGVLSGVVLTATGITTTQLGFSHQIETFVGVWMAFSAMLAGMVYILRGVKETGKVKILWTLGGICLTLAMILAFLYAMRQFIVIDFLSIPNMQAIHGTLNALGFGTLMLTGWVFKRNTDLKS